MAQQGPRTEFAQALRALLTERGLDVSVIINALKEAYIAAYKRDAKERGEDIDAFNYSAEINEVTGEAQIFSWPLEGAEADKKDVTPPGFGRIAAQTAKQVIHQKIREAERDVVMEEYSGRVGTIISGIVLRFDGSNVRVDLGKTEALMPSDERIFSERLSSGQRLSFLIKEIAETPRGQQIILSRADSEFVKKIFAREVPEIASGNVEIKGIAREPGVRTKIAVYSAVSGVDPVGSCVGQKGVRVQAVTNELGGERIDIIPWTEDTEAYIKSTIAPATVLTIKLEKKGKAAHISVPEDQLSQAIGKDGQNVRLASELTGYTITIEGDPSVVTKPVEAPVVEEVAPVEAEETPVAEEVAAVEAVETPASEETMEEVAPIETPEVEAVKASDTTEAEVAAEASETEPAASIESPINDTDQKPSDN